MTIYGQNLLWKLSDNVSYTIC
uniref:Uncharacterized protein n=1 Tax=Rhizophora mucronata TaxID=61149 RepID=A0A2P2P0R7_RHIMU